MEGRGEGRGEEKRGAGRGKGRGREAVISINHFVDKFQPLGRAPRNRSQQIHFDERKEISLYLFIMYARYF